MGVGRLTCFGVTLKAEHDLGCSIPTCGHVLCHEAPVLLWVDREASGQAKVTNLELAVRINQKIARFEISMQNICRVDVLESTEDLIDE